MNEIAQWVAIGIVMLCVLLHTHPVRYGHRYGRR